MNMTKLLNQTCTRGKEVRFLESPAGFYLGTLTEEGFPNCRFSSYFESMEEFESCTFRDCMEVQHCNKGFGCFKTEPAVNTNIIDFCRECGSALSENQRMQEDKDFLRCKCGTMNLIREYKEDFQEIDVILDKLIKNLDLLENVIAEAVRDAELAIDSIEEIRIEAVIRDGVTDEVIASGNFSVDELKEYSDDGHSIQLI